MRTSGVKTITSLATFADTVAGGKMGVAAIAFYNESPYALQIAYGGASQTVPAMTGELLEIAPLASWDGQLQITPQTIYFAPASQGAYYYNVYGVGERVPAGFPVALSRQQNLGSQPRVITIPVGPPALRAIQVSVLPAQANSYLDNLALWQTSFGPLQSNMVLYIYYYKLSMNPSGATVVGEFLLTLRELHAGTELRNTICWREFLGLTGAVSSGGIPLGPSPLELSISPFNSTVDQMQLALFCASFPAGSATLDINWGAGIDFTTNQPIPFLGGSNNYQLQQAPW